MSDNPFTDKAAHGSDSMTMTQAAVFLRVSLADMMTAVRDGTLPFHQSNRRIWFSRAELLACLGNRSAVTRKLHGDGREPA